MDQEYVNFESIKKEAEFKGFAGERSIDEQALKTISNDYQYSGVVNPHRLKKMIGDLPLKEKRKARKPLNLSWQKQLKNTVCNDSAPSLD